MHKRFFLCAGLVAIAVFAVSISSHAQIAVGVAIRVGPPALPVYTQPICPGPGYVWTPGYWAYGDEGYYWVPGTWVVAPVGMLWTPGYWGWSEGVYVWHVGYWGPHVGFYGGINYGFGYTGVGYAGGYWRGHDFFYNRTMNNVNFTSIHNTYEKTVVISHTTINNISYNGGPAGINARANAAEEAAAREHHVEATREQMDHEHAARNNRNQLASVNHGRPAFGATSKAGEFNGHGNTNAAHFNPPHSSPSGGANADRGHTDYVKPGHNNDHGAAQGGSSQPSHQAHVESTPHSSGSSSGHSEHGGSHGSEHGGEQHQGHNHER